MTVRVIDVEETTVWLPTIVKKFVFGNDTVEPFNTKASPVNVMATLD